MANYMGEVCIDIKSPLHHMAPGTNCYLSSDFVDLAKSSFLDFPLFPEIEEKLPGKLMEPMSPENNRRGVFTSLENSGEPQQQQESSASPSPLVVSLVAQPPSKPEDVVAPTIKKRRRRRRKDKKDKDRPKKSPSAYILWLTEARKSRASSNLSAAELTRVLAEEWKSLPDKSKWFEEAERLKKQYIQDREKYTQNMHIRIKEAISNGILHPNQSDNMYTLGKKLISRDSYDEMADPKKQEFCKQIRSISPSYYGYFEDEKELSSLSENDDWVLSKSQRKRKEKERLRKRKVLRKKKDKLKPKKPPSSYLLFLSEMRPQLAHQFPQLPMTEITTKISELWNALGDRTKWSEQASLRKEKYKEEMKEYEKLRKDLQEVVEQTPNPKKQLLLPNKPVKRQRRRHLPKDPFKPKKPQTAFLLFLNATREDIKKENPGIVLAELTKEAGHRWKALEDKTEWELRSHHLKQRYLEDMRTYNEKKEVQPGVVEHLPQVFADESLESPMDEPSLIHPIISPPTHPAAHQIYSSSGTESDGEEDPPPTPVLSSSREDKVTVERIDDSPHTLPACYQQSCTPSEDSDFSEESMDASSVPYHPELDDHSYSKFPYSVNQDLNPASGSPYGNHHDRSVSHTQQPNTMKQYSRGKPAAYTRRLVCGGLSEDDSSE